MSAEQSSIMQPETVQSSTLEQWLERLTQQHPVAIDLGLERVGEVARRLGLLDGPLAPKVITVAGTNGKGSTVTMIDACARAHGLKSVSYTSPHLLHYNERVRINGEPVSDDQLIKAFEQIEFSRLEMPEISLSYFEVGTLAAALIIKEQAPDIAVLEVGLGGRLDAVNLFDADVAIVTTIALDHADYLGTDISVIGQEKAGIMRRGRYAVLGSRELPASVSDHARKVGVKEYVTLGTDFDHESMPERSQQWHWSGKGVTGELLSLDSLPDPHLPLDNAASALQALTYAGVVLTQDKVIAALQHVSLPGRMQRMGRWVLDVAHNPHAARYIASRISAADRRGTPPSSVGIERTALLAMLGDKDADEVIAALAPVVNDWVCASIEGPRGRKGEDLAQRVKAHGGEVLQVTDSVEDALAWIVQSPRLVTHEVLVCGSFVTVAAALEWLEGRV